MEHDLMDPLERRLRASRPADAMPAADAFDADLLAHVRGLPIARRRRVPRAVAAPVAAGAVVTATAAAVLLIGGPGGAGGPPDAEAIVAQTLHWFAPPAGTVLHTRSVATQDGRTTTVERWQSADDPRDVRERVDDPAGAFETAGTELYDPATDTIYDGPATASPRPPDDPAFAQAGDGIVIKVRTLLQEGDMEVSGPVIHDGTQAWAVSLKPDAGRPVWTLWVSAQDGRPLELRDPGRDADEAPQVIEWPAYEVLAGSDARTLVTLSGAHPDARVVRDPAAVNAAWDAIGPEKTDHVRSEKP